MWKRDAIAYLNRYYSPCGKCLICGHRDKRHRMWDAFMHFDDEGYTPEQIHEEYPDASIEHIKAVLAIQPYRRGGEFP